MDHFFWRIGLWGMLAVCVGCQDNSEGGNDEITTKSGEIPVETTYGDNSTIPPEMKATQAGNVLAELQNGILALDVSPNQASAITNGAADNLAEAGLAEPIDLESIDQYMHRIIEGAVKALDHSDAQLSTPEEMNKVLDVVMKSVFGSIKGRGDAISDEAIFQLLEHMTAAAMKSLVEGGYAKEHLDEAARVFVAASVGSLDEAGFPHEKMGPALDGIMSGAMREMDELGVTEASELAPVCQSIMIGAIEALGHLGIEDEIYAGIVDELMFGTIENLDEAGFTHEDVAHIGDDIMFGAISTLDELNLSDETFPLVVDAMLFGAISALDEVGFTHEEIGGVIDEIMLGSVDAMGEVGLTDDKVAVHMDDLAAGAVRALNHVWLTLEEKELVLGFLMYGAVGAIDEAAIQDKSLVLSAMLTGAISSLDEAVEKQADMEQIIDTMLHGAVRGLGQLSLSDADMITHIDDLMAGALDGVSEFGLDPAVAADLTQLERIMEAAMHGAIDAIDELGASADIHDELVGEVVRGAVMSLDEAGLNADQMVRVIDELVRGAVLSLDVAGRGEKTVGNYGAFFAMIAFGAFAGLAETSIQEDLKDEALDEIFRGIMEAAKEEGFTAVEIDKIITTYFGENFQAELHAEFGNSHNLPAGYDVNTKVDEVATAQGF